ncbi:MAG TPA: ABC transporter permease [Pirellulales bacterium]|nr:ABC transporter permease [Pirellulales bacterium]
MRPSLLFVRMAVQNLGRRPARTLLLSLTVAVGTGAVFTAVVLRQAIENSMNVGLARMGADLLVVPRDATTNLTSALLCVEATEPALAGDLPERIARLPGVELVAPQRHVALPGAHGHEDLVAFDPARDFTVQSWLADKMERGLAPGDVIVGARREELAGDVITLFGRQLPVYGKLPLTGVGPFERSLFVSFETLALLDEAAQKTGGSPLLDPAPPSYSGLLVRLQPGFTVEQFRFAAAQFQEVKIVSGNQLYSSVRHALGALLSSVVGLMLLMLLSTTLLVAALFWGLLVERRRELALLLAIGLRPRGLVHVILAEAALTTAGGGVCGAVFGAAGILLCERSLGFFFERIRVTFLLPASSTILLSGLACALVACGIGLAGAVVPAWWIGHEEPYELLRADG